MTLGVPLEARVGLFAASPATHLADAPDSYRDRAFRFYPSRKSIGDNKIFCRSTLSVDSDKMFTEMIRPSISSPQAFL